MNSGMTQITTGMMNGDFFVIPRYGLSTPVGIIATPVRTWVSSHFRVKTQSYDSIKRVSW